jgi:hypothetical protein
MKLLSLDIMNNQMFLSCIKFTFVARLYLQMAQYNP